MKTFLKNIDKKSPEQDIILKEIIKSIDSLIALGLEYLSLSRTASSLSPGEIQRISLAKLINSKLRNVCFVFDEPSAGVYPEQNSIIINYMKELARRGNTVIVVEHDRETIENADFLVDIGPKAGKNGGEIIFAGSLTDFFKQKPSKSETYKYLSNEKEIEKISSEKKNITDFFAIKNAEINNLKNIKVKFKKSAINTVCGVSGAGKKSLINQTLLPLLKNEYHKQLNAKGNPEIENAGFDKIIAVNRSPIGKTSRSTPATYTKIHDLLRNLFASLPDAQKLGLSKSHFSFNSKSGSCPNCGGMGKTETGMHFLGNVENICPVCNGKRFKKEVLDVKYLDKYSISDILDKTVDEAIEIFAGNSKILKSLQTLQSLGLGYLSLGQSSNTLSGGEAQRIKLATEWLKAKKTNNLFILDEPTNGLHFSDIQLLINWLNQISNNNNTVIAIEYNLDFIKNSDYIVELGETAGENGGNVIFSGDFSSLLSSNKSLIKNFFNVQEIRVNNKKSTLNINNKLIFKGVKTNNLKNIDISIPLNKHTVITGNSGSGKSSLAFDTIYAESINHFLDSFPAYFRQYSIVKTEPDYDFAEAFTPAIALKQENAINSPRSTLAVFTGIHELYRLMFSRFGDKFCAVCNSKLNSNLTCEKCGHKSIDTNLAHNFSFNNSLGTCQKCKGIGEVLSVDSEGIITDYNKNIYSGALKKHKSLDFYLDKDGQFMAILFAVGAKYGFDYNLPLNNLPEKAINIALFGIKNEEFDVEWHFKRKNRKGVQKFKSEWKGISGLLVDEYYRKNANGKGEELMQLLQYVKCDACKGTGYEKDILSVKINNCNIACLLEKNIDENILFIKSLAPEKFDYQLIENILQILKSLKSFRLSYLNLNRKTMSLSGGELQRTLLSTHLNSHQNGITFILDEPSKGLHMSDVEMISANINNITDNNNTVITVEHNNLLIAEADNVIELGPGAGKNGGKIIFEGDAKKYVNSNDNRLILNNIKQDNSSKTISIKSANANNLKNIDVEFNLHNLNAVTGISGAGKTSLLYNVLYKSFINKKAVNCTEINGLDNISEVRYLSQKQILKTENSSVLTFLGAGNKFKKFWASLPEAKEKAFKAQHFSKQNKTTQCPVCKGKGYTKVSLDFLSDVKKDCEYCNATGFKSDILDIRFNEKNIAEVLNMTILELKDFFNENELLHNEINKLIDAGLSYIQLGQSIKKLSGGEFQRLRLVKSLLDDIQNSIFVLDEPSVGLSINDMQFLPDVFSKLLTQKNTIIMIEHNPELIKLANHIVDLGHKSGDFGGDLIVQGTVENIKNTKDSLTGRYL